jgi:PKD repeat protein
LRYAHAAALVVVAIAVGACRDESPTAPSLSASCSATPTSGLAPLVVHFAVNVDGAQGRFDVVINYGDGTNGTDVTAAHTYAVAGTYSVAFNISTSSQSALCSTVVRADSASGAVGPTPAPGATPTPRPSGPNQAPAAVFRTVPASDSAGQITGRNSLSVQFNMCPSADPERDPMNFTMDFEGDGTTEVSGTTGGDCRRSRTYGFGTYRPRICVTDLNSGLAPMHPYQCKSYTVIVTRS